MAQDHRGGLIANAKLTASSPATAASGRLCWVVAAAKSRAVGGNQLTHRAAG